MDKHKWWVDNQPAVNKLPPKLRPKVKDVLETKGVTAAEKFLWNAILAEQGLSMSAGQEGLVYVGGETSLQDLHSEIGKIEAKKGNTYGTVVRNHTNNGTNGKPLKSYKRNPLNILDYIG